jgi:transcriptional regulator with XRE-family HTH domain
MAGEKSVAAGFDVKALVAALESERASRDLAWKDVAEQSGVSASTLTRLTQGRRPDVDSLAALTAWLNVPADRFMRSATPSFGAAAPLTQITAILRQDPNLNPEGAAALEELIKATYKRLRKPR